MSAANLLERCTPAQRRMLEMLDVRVDGEDSTGEILHCWWPGKLPGTLAMRAFDKMLDSAVRKGFILQNGEDISITDAGRAALREALGLK